MSVYAIRCGDYVKVGTTATTDARRRLRQVQAMCPYPCKLVGLSHAVADTGGLTLESWHHLRLAPWHHWGEWFRLSHEVLAHLGRYFAPCEEIAPRSGQPPRRLGPAKARLRDAAKGRLG